MAADFHSDDGKRLSTLLARSLAFEWCGLDAAADQLRQACAQLIYDTLLRADIASDGTSSNNLVKVMKGLAAAVPQTDPILPTQLPEEEGIAQKLASVICSFLPPDIRSLDAFIQSVSPQGPPQPKKSGSPSAPARMTKDQQNLSRQITAMLLPLASVSSRWPTVRKLGELLEKSLKQLAKKGVQCLSSSADIATWLERVPLEAAISENVATAISAAFAAASAGTAGLVKSGKELGTVVHDLLAAKLATQFVKTNFDKILVAGNVAYVPPWPVARSLEAVKAAFESVNIKDYSLQALAQSRGSMSEGYVRARDSETSLEDLAVFLQPTAVTVSTELGLDGRPEVYEVKPVSSLVTAVPQVTAYSWNYLLASVNLQCTKLLSIPGAKLRNSVMLPADPEHHSLSLPLLSVLELSSVATSPALPASAGAAVANLVAQFLSTSVKAGPYIAIPFMASGLYGVIPYFVIDSKAVKELAAALKAILAIMLTALLAYLAARGLIKGKRLSTQGLLVGLVAFIVLVVIFVAIIATLPEDLVVVGAVAAVALVVIVVSKAISGPQGGTDQPNPDNRNIYLGALHAFGITADEFVSWMTDAAQLFAAIWGVDASGAAVNVVPPG